MEECLPKMTKSRRELRSSDDRVTAARQEVELAQTRPDPLRELKSRSGQRALDRSSSQPVSNVQAGGGRGTSESDTDH